MTEIDWSECPLVETKASVQRGRPMLKGTRMPVQGIVDNWESGLDEPDIATQFELSEADVQAILSYAAEHRLDPHPV